MQSMLENSDDKIIVESIIAITRGIDLTIVAEDIETPEQQQAIAQTGCHIDQSLLLQ